MPSREMADRQGTWPAGPSLLPCPGVKPLEKYKVRDSESSRKEYPQSWQESAGLGSKPGTVENALGGCGQLLANTRGLFHHMNL